MRLSKEQVKEAKNFCKANGLNTNLVNKDLGNGFWSENCKGTFEGYLENLLNVASKFDGSGMLRTIENSARNCRTGKYGLASL